MADWGITVAGASDNNVAWRRAMGGVFSGTGQELTGLKAYIKTSGSGNIRIAVYVGGDITMAPGPEGATLVWDGGQITEGGGDAFIEAVHPGPYPALVNGSTYWIVVKSEGNVCTTVYSGSTADREDFTILGSWRATGPNGEEATAYESTWATDTGTFVVAQFYSWNLTYQATTTDVNLHGIGRGILRGIGRGVG